MNNLEDNDTWLRELNDLAAKEGVGAIRKWLASFPDAYSLDGYVKDAYDVVMAYYNGCGAPTAKEKFFEIVTLKTRSLPDVLFKYISLDYDNTNDKKFNTLHNKQIYLSAPEKLNDPFDCDGFFCDNAILEKQLKHLGDYKPSNYELAKYVKVSAMTTIGLDKKDMTFPIPMWAHYANNHKGFCISYSKKDKNNQLLLMNCLPVKYEERRVDITKIMLLSIFGKLFDDRVKNPHLKQPHDVELGDMLLACITMLFFNIKHKTWEHEKEIRCVVPRNKEEEDQYLPAVPLEIFIGKSCSLHNAQRIFEISKELNVPIYLMEKGAPNNPEFVLTATPIGSIEQLEERIALRKD